MESLKGKSESSCTLVRGAQLLRQQTMSLEHDAQYAELVAERDRLLVTQNDRDSLVVEEGY